MGTNMLSSFADAGAVAMGLERTPLVISYDLFLNETARRFADIVLPSTAWLEELGCKMTHTHLYLMEQALTPAGETRSLSRVVKELAERLKLEGFHRWASQEAMMDAILDHPCTGHATVAALRAEGGCGPSTCPTSPIQDWTSTRPRARSSSTPSRQRTADYRRCRPMTSPTGMHHRSTRSYSRKGAR